MFSRLTTALTFGLVVITLGVSAAVQCKTGELQCCTLIDSPHAFQVSAIMRQLKMSAPGDTASIGIGCTALGGTDISQCSGQPTCCQDKPVNGLSFGCVPANVVADATEVRIAADIDIGIQIL